MPKTPLRCRDCDRCLQGKAVYCVSCYAERLFLCGVCCEPLAATHGVPTVKRAYRKHQHVGGPKERCRVCGGLHPSQAKQQVCHACKNERWILDEKWKGQKHEAS
jgi:hypothetical protein